MNLTNIGNTQITMSSREIAELTGKDHDNIRRDIKKMAEELSLSFEEKVEASNGGRPSLVFHLPKRETLILISGYNVQIRAKIIDRWQELEAQAAKPATPLLPSTHARLIIEDALQLAKLFEVPVHIAQVESVKQARLMTGHDYTPYLLHAPAQNNIRDDEMMLEPTELGKVLGMSSIKMNKQLEALGMQVKVDGAWVPTEKAKGLCSRHQWISGTKSGYNLKWKVKAVREMVEA